MSALRRRPFWELTVGVLALNLWTAFLVIPLIYEDALRTPLVLALATLPLVALLFGTALRNGTLLLAVFPASLVLPAWVEPQLVGATIYAGWTFVFVTLGLATYTIGALYALRIGGSPPLEPSRTRDLPRDAPDHSIWQRRARLSVFFAAATVAFPLLAIAALFMRPSAASAWRAAYPERAAAAAVFFCLVLMNLWVLIYRVSIVRPLEHHLRGDPQVHAALQRLRARPGARALLGFYLQAALVVAAAILFLLI